MITIKEKEDILSRNTKIISLITDFKALVAENGLPVSDNIQTLETALRSQLFQKLLAVDKGLKLRWELLKTDEARIKLITDTVNLDGYSQVQEMQIALNTIERLYKQVYANTFLYDTVPFSIFAEKWEMDLDAVLTSMVFDWTGKEDVLEFFQNLAPSLAKLREVLRAAISTSYTLHATLQLLDGYYTPESHAGSIEIKESAVMGLVNRLNEKNARHLFTK